MANQQATFNLNIRTSADLKGINELQKALSQIKKDAMNPDTAIGDNEQAKINKMLKSVHDLELAIQRAYNPKINTINVDKFKQSLIKSNTTVQELKANLMMAGTQGAQAFNSMAASMMQFGRSVRQSSAFLDKISTSIGNTVRYQVLNSLWRSITGSIQEAYGYVKNLDSSLNKIQIVTEKSAESMKRFATQANNAAQNLSAKTTDYTDASLIYYQQGLDDKEVKGRTDTTIKMANVLGESASEVSNYMTAIWNNFDDGSKSLDYFGDVITNLGAHTASSAAEIAEGLEKFAAVADTVGLSYEYATASLATVVAETRQSADTVGTAFKTLFARIQGLKLGETLDDGTDLTKYSKALEAVGVSIKDQQGNLKDMDTLLEEMGAKWQMLAKDQQVALAQTVAGTRQYTQLVALMDNWDKVRENIDLAADSTGTLDKKQQIYEESVEAHLKRSAAAWENFYDSMLDSDTINTLASFSQGLGNIFAFVADSIGGLIPSFFMLSSTVTKIFSNQIAGAIMTVRNNLQSLKVDTEDVALKQAELMNIVGTNSFMVTGKDTFGREEEVNQSIQKMMNFYQQVSAMKRVMSQDELEYSNQLIKNYSDITNKLLEQEDIIRDTQNAVRKALGENEIDFAKMSQAASDAQTAIYEKSRKKEDGTINKNETQIIEKQKEAVIEYGKAYVEAGGNVENLRQIINRTFRKGVKIDNDGTVTFTQNVKYATQEFDNFADKIQNHITVSVDAQQADRAKEAMERAREENERLQLEFLKEISLKMNINSIVQFTASLGRAASAITSIHNLGSIWSNKDLSVIEQIGQSMLNLSFVIPSVAKSLGTAIKATKTYTAVQKMSNLETELQNADLLKNASISEALNKLKQKNLTVEQRSAAMTELNTALLNSEASAEDRATISQYGLNAAMNANPILAIISAAVMLIGVLWSLADALGIFGDGEEKANEKLKDSIEKYDETTEALKQLEDQLSQVKDRIKELTELPTLTVVEQEELAKLETQNALLEAQIALLEKKQELEGEQVIEDAISANKSDSSKKYNDSEEYASAYSKEGSETTSALQADDWITHDENGDIVVKGNNEVSKKALNILFDDTDVVDIFDHSGELNSDFFDSAFEIDLSDPLAYDKWVEQNKSQQEKIEEAKSILKRARDDETDVGQKSIYTEQIAALDEWLDSLIEDLKDGGVGSSVSEDMQQAYKDIVDDKENVDKVLPLLYQKINNGKILTDDEEKLLADYEQINERYYQMSGAQTEANVYGAAARSLDQGIKDKLIGAESDIKGKTGKEFEEALSNAGLDENDISKINQQAQALGVSTEVLIQKSLLYKDSWDRTGDSVETVDNKISNLQTQSEQIDGLIEKLKKGTKLTKDEQAAIDELEGNYEALNLIRDRGSKEYIKALRQIQELLEADEEKLKQQTLEDTLKKAETTTVVGERRTKIAKEHEDGVPSAKNVVIETVIDSTEFNDQMKEILDADYSIEVSIQTDVKSDYDKLISQMNEVREAASKIGDDFIVAANDVEMLGQTFPGILQNMTYLSDGTIQLNQDAVASAMWASQEESKAAVETTVNRLKSEQNALKAKAEGYRQIATMIRKASEDQIVTEQEKTNILKEIDETTSKNNERFANQYIENEKAKADASNENSAAAATNMAEMTKSGAQNAYQMGEYWSQVFETLSTGEAPPSPPNIVPTYKGVAGSSAQTSNTGSATAESTPKDTKKLGEEDAEYWETAAAALERQAASYDTYIAAAYAQLNQNGSALTNVAKGLGTDGKSKDKKGGGGSKDKDKDLKRYEEEFDALHDINRTIKELDDSMAKLEKRQSHLFGKELANSLKEENALLEKQKANYQELLNQQSKELGKTAGAINAITKELADCTLEINADTGEIQNYGEITLKMYEMYAKAIENLKNKVIDDKQFEAVKKQYENFKNYIKEYESGVDKVNETKKKIEDLVYKQIENNFKAWEAEINVKLDLEQAKRDWSAFLRDINTDFKLTYQRASQVTNGLVKEANSMAETIRTQIGAMQDIEGEYDKIANGTGSDKFVSGSEAQKTLNEYLSALEDSAESLYDMYKNAWDLYLTGIDEIANQFEDIIDKFERIADTLDHEAKMIDLLYGENDYEKLDKVYSAQIYNTKTMMASYRDQTAFWKDQYDKAVAMNGPDSKDAYNIYKNWQDAQQKLYETEEKYIEQLVDKFNNAIDKTLGAFEKKLTKGLGFDWLLEEWDLLQNKAEGYYDEVQRIYQLQNLKNNWQKAIENSASLKLEGKLKEIMEDQLSILEKKEHLSESDITLAEKRLALAQTQIALEEAQNAKNSMKLTRDANGNWTYQYIADQNDVLEKEQELLKAQNDVRDYAKEIFEQTTQDVWTAFQEMMEKIKEAESGYYYGMSDAEKQGIADKVQTIRDVYTGSDGIITKLLEENGYMTGELNKSTAEMLYSLYNIDGSNYDMMSMDQQGIVDGLVSTGVTGMDNLYQGVAQAYDAIQDKCEEVNAASVESWNSTAAEILRTWIGEGDVKTEGEEGEGEEGEENEEGEDSGYSSYGSVLEAMLGMFDQFIIAQEEFDVAVEEGTEAAGEDYTNVEEKIYDCVVATQSLENATQELVEEACIELEIYRQVLSQVEQAWYDVKGAVEKAGDTAIEYLERQCDKANAYLDILNSIIDALMTINELGGDSGSAVAESGSTNNSNGKPKTYYYATGLTYTDGYHNDTPVKLSNKKYLTEDAAIKAAQKLYNESRGGIHSVLKPITEISSAASGGYTGEWSGSGNAEVQDGKLAWLHQKELILNADDTKNMLSMVNTIRDMGSINSSIQNVISSKIASMLGGMMGLKPGGLNYSNLNNNGTVYKIENITAEFPNANDVTTIQEAIMSLPNIVSQYVNKK